MLTFLCILAVIVFCALAWWLTFLYPAWAIAIVIVALLFIAFRDRIVDFFVYGLFKDTH